MLQTEGSIFVQMIHVLFPLLISLHIKSCKKKLSVLLIRGQNVCFGVFFSPVHLLLSQTISTVHPSKYSAEWFVFLRTHFSKSLYNLNIVTIAIVIKYRIKFHPSKLIQLKWWEAYVVIFVSSGIVLFFRLAPCGVGKRFERMNLRFALHFRHD